MSQRLPGSSGLYSVYSCVHARAGGSFACRIPTHQQHVLLQSWTLIGKTRSELARACSAMAALWPQSLYSRGAYRSASRPQQCPLSLCSIQSWTVRATPANTFSNASVPKGLRCKGQCRSCRRYIGCTLWQRLLRWQPTLLASLLVCRRLTYLDKPRTLNRLICKGPTLMQIRVPLENACRAVKEACRSFFGQKGPIQQLEQFHRTSDNLIPGLGKLQAS